MSLDRAIQDLRDHRAGLAHELDLIDQALAALERSGPPAPKPAPPGPVAKPAPPRPAAATQGIPRAKPGIRREFTDDQKRILLDEIDDHGITATARKFDVSETVLRRMKRISKETRAVAAPTPAATRPAPAVQAPRSLTSVPAAPTPPQLASNRYVCSCGLRFETGPLWGAHHRRLPDSEQRAHRLTAQPAAGIVGTRERTVEEDAAWESRRRAAYEDNDIA